MADKDQIRNEEEIVKHDTPEVTELDDRDLDEASGGAMERDADVADGNNNCLC